MARLGLTNLTAALRALRSNVLRSTLTVCAVAIGVGSVVLLVALGRGVERDVRVELDRIGSNLVLVVPGALIADGMPNPMALAGVSTLTEADVAHIARLPGVDLSVPLMVLAGSVERGTLSVPTLVVGVSARLPMLTSRTMAEGRFFGDREEGAPVCVVAYDVGARLFAADTALGRKVKVAGEDYTVVGVMAPEPPSLASMFTVANLVCIPPGIARERFPQAQVNRIAVTLSPDHEPKRVLASIREVMLRNHGGRDDFSVLTQEQLLAMVYRILGVVTALLASISGISLVVAGVGVMNIMLVTVTERTREIGVRKAVGARRRDVFTQFLAEAVLVCLLGGAAGLGLAQAVCSIAAAATPLRPAVTADGVLLALAVCVGVGLVFGVAPAARAARQSPIEALRHE